MFSLTLDLKPVAWSILHILQGMPELKKDKYYFNTAAWYNGRERGIVISVINYKLPIDTRAMHIVFTENRNSDDIVVYKWRGPTSINPPTIADMTDEVWKNSTMFAADGIYRAANFIYDEIEKYLEDN